MNNLAILLKNRGNFVEAEALLRTALAREERTLGNDHPLTLVTMSNLARLLEAKGDYTAAEALYRQTIEAMRRTLGEAHPKTLMVVGNFARLLQKQGDFVEADQLFREICFAELHIRDQTLDGRGLETAIHVITDSIRKKPEAGKLAARSFLYGQEGRWPQAANDLFDATQLEPRLPGFALGPLLVETGDRERYADFHRRTLLLPESDDPQTMAERTLGLLILPGSTGSATARQLAETAVTVGTNHVRFARFQFVKALAEYRDGNFSDAAEWARRSLTGSSTNVTTAVAAEAVLAMAQHRLNQSAKAQESLAHASKVFQVRLPQLESGNLGENWPDWLVAHILLREARSLIGHQQ